MQKINLKLITNNVISLSMVQFARYLLPLLSIPYLARVLGPKAEQNRTVLDLIKDLSDGFIIKNNSPKYEITDNIPFHEAGLLNLNCDKALFHLKWEANLNYHQCINLVRDWYLSNINGKDMYSLTLDQIDFYEKRAEERNLHWALN